MYTLKVIAQDGVPAALQKAERYRLLREAEAAESICLDVLAVDPTNQAATVTLLLAFTDQIEGDLAGGVARARDVLARLTDEYKRHYYAGMICERRANAQLHHGALTAQPVAAEWLREAMQWYERAEAMRPPGNEESILRWNTCARRVNAEERRRPPIVEAYEPALE
jgi:ATP/maltotriose-dependent transcriptional regulator MalT